MSKYETIIIPSNNVFKVIIHPRHGYPLGYLWGYKERLCAIMNSSKSAKYHCEWYKNGLLDDDLYDREAIIKSRSLFREFLNRYMNGEFKYRKCDHHLSKDRYFHELSAQTQRNIKRVADTLNEIYNG